ncbi:MAG: beta-lactamase family protein [Deltaproteobacteria bacterium]|nr:beta-lactamase family protein [Deltaproteobacteria bacterium]MBW2419479.1 beta-lactamase family protein [Deltaproteobacteria bacterium]
MSAADLGMDPDRLQRVTEAIAADVEAERYDGAVVLAARRGQVALHEAVGFAERASGREAKTDDVFHLFSVTKTFTTAAVLRCVDRGDLRLTTPVADIIPEFGVKGKQRVTVAQLLCHRAGIQTDLPFVTPDVLGNTEALALAVSDQAPYAKPGQIVSYSPIGAFAVLAEIVRRIDGGTRPFRQLLDEDFFLPLGMKNTSLALRADLASRRVPVIVRDPTPGIIPPAALEAINVMQTDTFEMPGGGGLGTAHDLFRWSEMLRRGGELDGVRLLSPALLRFALRNHTGELPNHIFDGMCERRGWEQFPAYLGLGFFLRGHGIFAMPFGLTASSGTYGGLGAGSTMFWVDPERELAFVCLTSGVLEDSRNFERMQRLSDLVLSALTD